MNLRIGVVLCVAAAVPAADLLSELAIASPRGENRSGPGDAALGWQAFVQEGSAHRIDGVALITREQAAPDAQMSTSLTWNRLAPGNGDFGGTNYNWTRLVARVGTDPLADAPGQALAGVQGLWSAADMLSAAVDAAWSADRGAVLSAEVCLWFVRLRAERNREQSCVRIGTGPRFLGSDAPWSGAVLVDYVAGQAYGEDQIQGGQVEAWVAYRVSAHLLLAMQAQAASCVRSTDASLISAGSGALALGCTW